MEKKDNILEKGAEMEKEITKQEHWKTFTREKVVLTKIITKSTC